MINRVNDPLDRATCYENCPLAHYPKVVGSNPNPATLKASYHYTNLKARSRFLVLPIGQYRDDLLRQFSPPFEEMVTRGIITKKVANIVKSEVGEPKVGQQDLSQEGKTMLKDSKKSRVFELFDQGKRPGDPEVKALVIKPETAYRYYQEWKKTQNHL